MTNEGDEMSAGSRGSHAVEVSELLDAIGECLAQTDPFDKRCVVVLNTPERRKAHKALWQLQQMASLRLTDEERAVIEVCATHWRAAPASKILRGLLERLG